MRFTVPRMSGLATATVIAALTFAPVDLSANGQRAARPGGQGSSGGGSGGGGGQRSGGGERVGTATPRSDGGSRSGGSSGGSGSRPRTQSTPAGSGSDDSGSDRSGTASRRRASDGQVAEKAVPRRDGGHHGGGTTIIVPGGYYGGYLPWGWAGLGFAGYYGGYYDPGYGYPAYSYSSGEAGLKLKVKPRDASVFVDGYFAGHVDQFDGMFQKLKVEPGPHRIEISADGYETLTFEIRGEPDQTTTYKGELNRVP